MGQDDAACFERHTQDLCETFTAETAQWRARKLAPAGRGSAQAEEMTRVYVYEAMNRAEAEARTVLATCSEGDSLRTQLAVLKRFSKQETVDTITLRRRICGRLLEQGKYFVGRLATEPPRTPRKSLFPLWFFLGELGASVAKICHVFIIRDIAPFPKSLLRFSRAKRLDG